MRAHAAAAWIDADAVLAAPSVEEVPEHAGRLLAEMREALSAEFERRAAPFAGLDRPAPSHPS